jgi:hypothetical protein
MRGIPSAATPDSSMPHDDQFSATISRLVRSRNHEFYKTRPRLLQCRSLSK